MEINAELIKELRLSTGCGILDCKKALTEHEGNMEKAVKHLREKGLASAAKKADRSTKEGLVFSYIHGGGRIGVLVEVNCETDFVARNEKFQELVKDISMHIAAANPRFVSDAEITPQVLEQEREIYTKIAKESGKPDAVVAKIVDGKIKKYAEEFCLLEQAYVKNPDVKVKDYINGKIAVIGENIVVRRFVRWHLGE
jgi:elongation factor Ts